MSMDHDQTPIFEGKDYQAERLRIARMLRQVRVFDWEQSSPELWDLPADVPVKTAHTAPFVEDARLSVNYLQELN